MKETLFVAKQETSMMATLRKVSFFKKLEERHIQDVLKMSRLRQFDAGETIIPEGVYDTYVYVLLGGEVEVHKKGATISIMNKIGDIFGELAIINDEPRSASISARTSTTCLAIDAAFLDSLMSRVQDTIYAVVYKIFAEIVANRLRVTSRELTVAREENRELRLKLEKLQS